MKNTKLNYARNIAKMGFVPTEVNADSLMERTSSFRKNCVTIIRRNNVNHSLNVDIAHTVRDALLSIMNIRLTIQDSFLVLLQKCFYSMKTEFPYQTDISYKCSMK